MGAAENDGSLRVAPPPPRHHLCTQLVVCNPTLDDPHTELVPAALDQWPIATPPSRCFPAHVTYSSTHISSQRSTCTIPQPPQNARLGSPGNKPGLEEHQKIAALVASWLDLGVLKALGEEAGYRHVDVYLIMLTANDTRTL